MTHPENRKKKFFCVELEQHVLLIARIPIFVGPSSLALIKNCSVFWICKLPTFPCICCIFFSCDPLHHWKLLCLPLVHWDWHQVIRSLTIPAALPCMLYFEPVSCQPCHHLRKKWSITALGFQANSYTGPAIKIKFGEVILPMSGWNTHSSFAHSLHQENRYTQIELCLFLHPTIHSLLDNSKLQHAGDIWIQYREDKIDRGDEELD